jgi:uncharacterized MAPEG superfamily protein
MMQDWLVPYAPTISMLGCMGILMLVQLIVLDVAGIRAGHVPGSAVTGDHGHFFFRAARAHANTNESIAIFILAALFGILHNASPWWLNAGAVVYVVARGAHMFFYYANVPLARSGSFVVAFVALIVMLAAGVTAGVR